LVHKSACPQPEDAEHLMAISRTSAVLRSLIAPYQNRGAEQLLDLLPLLSADTFHRAFLDYLFEKSLSEQMRR